MAKKTTHYVIDLISTKKDRLNHLIKSLYKSYQPTRNLSQSFIVISNGLYPPLLISARPIN